MEESDLDRFISSNQRLNKKNYMTREDFEDIFTKFIQLARAEALNQEAFGRQQMLRYG